MLQSLGHLRRVGPPLAAILLTLQTAGRAQEQPSVPLDVDLKEQVQVQLILIDAVVTDGADRTVAGLTLEDFELRVDGRLIEPASLDVFCPSGSTDDPRGGERERPCETGAAPAEARKIVLVFDYYHMEVAAEALEQAAETLDTLGGAGEQHMVVALANTLRIEQSFTTDKEEVRSTLERMRTDARLYAAEYGRLTERRFFDRLETLLDLLEQMEGRKVVILFAGPLLDDGFTYDPVFKRVAAASAQARTAFYPVDTGGVRSLFDPGDTGVLGPPKLRRLANETGGRMTANTNDLGLAYARAQRDTGCTYTLGFYDRDPQPDRDRRVTVRVDRPSHRVMHSRFYVVRSSKNRHRSLMRTASMAPTMFEDGAVSAGLFVVRPHSARRWESLIAVDIRLNEDLLPAQAGRWALRVDLRKPWGTVVKSFKRTIAPELLAAGSPAPATLRLFERVNVKPGSYRLGVVLAHPAIDRPLAATAELEVAEIPDDGPFLVGPILGTPLAGNASADDAALVSAGLAPLLEPEVVSGDPMASLVRVCRIDREPDDSRPPVVRVVRSERGEVVEVYEPAAVELESGSRVRCGTILDRLSSGMLKPGRYSLAAFPRNGDPEQGGEAGFTILSHRQR